MRRPTRPFVVEVKSSRRRSTRAPASIWGDIDLKAVEREAEAGGVEIQFPDYAAPEAPSECVPSASWDMPSQTQVVKTPFDDAEKPQIVATLDYPMTRETEADIIPAAISPVPPLQISKQSPRVHSQRLPKRTPVSEGPSAFSPSVDSDDLDALVGENHKLRLLFRAKLVRENALLRDLLGRY